MFCRRSAASVFVNNPSVVAKISGAGLLQVAAGLLLCVAGYWLAHREPYQVNTVLATVGGCNMPTDIYQAHSGTPVGSVVLLHGLSANKTVMAFTAQEFANQDLLVFVPDLPGHGKTPGPFSPARVEACAEALLRDLAARRALLPERTILAGHSMGGAIAARVAAKFPVAGVIAISPAPMHPAPGFAPEVLLFPTAPALAPHSLVLSAAWEPVAVRQIAQDLVTVSADPSNRYEVIPATTHVSILFAPATFDAMRAWTSQILGTSPAAPLPQNRQSLGCLIGVLGLSFLAPPFLREMATSQKSIQPPPDSTPPQPFLRTALMLIVSSVCAVVLLRFFVPFSFLHIFQGGYLSSYLFFVGAAMLVVHRKSFPSLKMFFTSSTAASLAAAMLLILLFAAWFELTFYEAWLTPARWLRFPLVALFFLPWHLAEEILLGSPASSPRWWRMLRFFLFRVMLWLILVAAILYLHSAQFALVLLVVYFVLFSILQRLATDVIRAQTRSLAAAAIFGAILLAGLVLAILPVA